MSDPTNNTQVEEPSNTEVHTETAPPAATEDITMSDAPQTDVSKTEAKPEEPKAEAAEVKPDATVQSEDTKSTEITENGANHNNGQKDLYRGKQQSKRKFDASLAAVDPAKFDEQARAQIEFYFSDSNLPEDKFLWEKTGGTENKPISLRTVCTFGRMRNFKPYEKVVAALKQSKKLIISGEEGQELVSRREPCDPTKVKDVLESRSAYVKGFGEEKPSTQFDIEAFFARYDSFTVTAVRMRRTPQGLFKGSIFLILETEEQLQTVLNLDPKPEWEGTPLEIRSKKSYVEEKNQLIKEGKIVPAQERGARNGPYDPQRGGRGRGRGLGRGNNNNGGRFGRGGRGGRDNRGGRGRGGNGNGRGRDRRNGDDSNDWKSRKAQDNKDEPNKNSTDAPASTEGPAPTQTPASADASVSNNKRPREDDAATEGAPAAKKVDSKPEAVQTDAPVKAAEAPAKVEE